MAASVSDISHGSVQDGDSGSSSDVKPPWYSHEKFERGREFFLRHMACITFSMHCSLVSGFSINNLLEPLVFTQQSDTGEKAFRRYLQTFYHIYLWMTEDVWEASSDGYTSLRIVRSMHGSVARRMSSKNAHKLYVSQYDMGLVQTGFFGAVLMYPAEFGIKCSREELDDYVFVWRVFGYKLGIKDEFNICRPSLADTQALVKDIERQCLIPSLLDPPKYFDKMADAYIEGSNTDAPLPLNSKHALLALIYDGLKVRYPTRLSFTDGLRYYFFKTFFFLIYHFKSVENFFNSFFQNTIFKPVMEKAKIEFDRQQKQMLKHRDETDQ